MKDGDGEKFEEKENENGEDEKEVVVEKMEGIDEGYDN